MTKYKRGSLALARRVFNTPQLIIESDLQRISQYIVDRANGNVELTVVNNNNNVHTESEYVEQETLESLAAYTNEEEKQRYHRRIGITNDGKRGNLFVEGTLVAKAGQIDADCMELISYEKLFSTFQMQVREGVEELLLHVDSGGGEANTAFEMATEVKNLAAKNNIKIISFIDGLSASAAYAWTSIADEVIARKGSEIGSIGVVVQLINNNKMLENIGITRKFITYGDSKVPFDDKGEFTDKFLSSLQKKVNKTGEEFTNFVATNRNMKVEDVIATEAEVYDAEEALKLGLIDKIMTKSEFFDDYLPKLKSNSNNQYYLQQEDVMSKEKDVTTNAKADVELTVEQLQSKLTEQTEANKNLTTEIETLKGQLADYQETKSQLETLQANYDSLVADNAEKEKLAKLDTRKAMLAAHIGKDNPQLNALVTSTEFMSDEQFEVLANSYGVTTKAKAEEFDELGDEGEQSDLQAGLQKEKQLTIAEKIALKAAKQ